ncbi:MAG: hypothetical protein KBT20_00905 [Bacteroidales bacterium]|nr:hypothetical protein [Candidatus Liminaster caballi]
MIEFVMRTAEGEHLRCTTRDEAIATAERLHIRHIVIMVCGRPTRLLKKMPHHWSNSKVISEYKCYKIYL